MNTKFAKYLSIIFLIGTALPCPVLADDGCHLVEYTDHYEAVCTGEASYVPQQKEDKKPVTVVVVNGERRPPTAVMDNAAAARRKLILDLRRKDQETNAPASEMSQ